jgi:hypothetical protein
MNLERLILDKLNDVHPRMLSETTLWSDVRLEESGTSLTDLRNAVRKLEGKSQVIAVTGEDVTRIKITTDGIARLSE